MKAAGTLGLHLQDDACRGNLWGARRKQQPMAARRPVSSSYRSARATIITEEI